MDWRNQSTTGCPRGASGPTAPTSPIAQLQLLPDQLFPDHELPDQLFPDQLLPDHEFPDHEFPDQLFPDHELPDQLLPDQLLPDHELPDHELPDHELPDQLLPDHELPDHELPDQLLPDHELPDQLLPDRLLPDHELPDQLLPDQPVTAEAVAAGGRADLDVTGAGASASEPSARVRSMRPAPEPAGVPTRGCAVPVRSALIPSGPRSGRAWRGIATAALTMAVDCEVPVPLTRCSPTRDAGCSTRTRRAGGDEADDRTAGCDDVRLAHGVAAARVGGKAVVRRRDAARRIGGADGEQARVGRRPGERSGATVVAGRDDHDDAGVPRTVERGGQRRRRLAAVEREVDDADAELAAVRSGPVDSSDDRRDVGGA